MAEMIQSADSGRIEKNFVPSAESVAPSLFGKDISVRKFKDCLVYLLVLGLIVRTGFLMEHAHSPSFGVPTLDQKYYDMAARLIDNGQDLHLLRGLRPLLYPLFLAAIYKVGGAHGIDLAIVTQHFLGVLTGILVALIGARLFRHRLCGIIGGALYLLAPVPLYFEGELLIESSYIFLICAGLLLILYTTEQSGRRVAWLWLACGAMTVLTAQARPNILVFMAVYPVLAAVRWWNVRRAKYLDFSHTQDETPIADSLAPPSGTRARGRGTELETSSPRPSPPLRGREGEKQFSRRVPLATALVPLWALAGGILMGIPWAFVNKMQSDHLQAIPSAGGVNLYLGNKLKADGMTVELNRRVDYSEEYEDSVEVWARQEYAAATHKPDNDPNAISKYWTHQAILEIKANPAHWLHLMAKKTWLMFWNAEIPNNKAFAFLQTEFAWLRDLPVRWVVLLMLAPAGIWAAYKFGHNESLVVLGVYLALYGAADVAFFICDRYRYPLWPAMAALAGGGAMLLVNSARQKQSRRLASVVASMVVMAGISLPNWFHAQLPTFARDYLFRSIAWFQKGRFPEALADLDESIELDTADATAWHQRGNVLLAMNRLPEARAQYEHALQIDDHDAGVWNNFAIALDQLGETNLAMRAYQHATDCRPPSPNAFLGLTFDELRLGRFNEASNTLARYEAQQRGPSAVELQLKAIVLRHFNRAREADSAETEARSLDSAAAAWAATNANVARP